MRFGACTGTPEQFPIIKKCGFDYAEIIFFLMANASEEEFSQWCRFAEESELPIEGSNCFVTTPWRLVGEKDLDGLLNYARNGFARLQKLGGSFAVIGSGGARRIPEGYTYTQAKEEFSELLCKLSPIAADHGITLCLEALNSAETDLITTVAEAADICRSIGQPNVACVADLYHMHRMDEPYSVLSEVGNLLHHVHIALPNRKIPKAADEAECRIMAKALHNCGYQGRITLEGILEPDFETGLRDFLPLKSVFSHSL